MKGKTKREFFDEMVVVRQRLDALEASEVERKQQVTALQRDVERLQLLREIGEAALTEQPPETIAQVALDRVQHLVPYRRANVTLFDFEAYQARVLAVRGDETTAAITGTVHALEKIKPVEGEGSAGTLLGHEVARALQAEGVPSCVSVPLVVGAAAIGVLNVWAPDCGDFKSEDVELIHEVAGTLALAVQQTISRGQLQRHARELVALYNAAQAMVSFLDLPSVLKTIISEAKSLLEAEVASVLLRSGNQLIFEASVGYGAETLIGKQVPVVSGIAGWVVRKNRPACVNDAQQDPRFDPAVDQTSGLTTRSVLAVPLVAKDTISGVIEVLNKSKPDGQLGIFFEQDQEILVAMAGPAALAIENARAYQTKVKQFERLQSRLTKK